MSPIAWLPCIFGFHLFALEASGELPQPQLQAFSNSIQESREPGLIRGRVSASDSGIGVNKVLLVLRMMEARELLTARTNSHGEYEFKEVTPGRYWLRATRHGYVPQTYGQKSGGLTRGDAGTPLEVRAGETLEAIDFRLIRCAVVEGRIVDQDNDPVVGASVQLVRYRRYHGKRQFTSGGSASTDDRGQYRIFDVPPGSYYLKADFPQSRLPEGAAQPVLSLTYYPGVSSPQEASKIQVTAGEVRDIDVTMIATLGYTISGHVLGTDGRPSTEGVVLSQRVDPDDVVGNSSPSYGYMDREGRFKITKLPRGRHRLTAFSNREGKQQAASIVVDLANEDAAGVSLTLGGGAEISGRIGIEGPGSQSKRIQIQLMPESGTLRAKSFGGKPESNEVRPDSTFTISGVIEGVYRFMVNSPEDNSYVKSIRAQGQELVDESFELRNNQRLAGVEVLISTQGGQISGVVKQSDNGGLVKDAAVVLFSTDTAKRGVRRFTKTSQTDQTGSFSLRGIVPGEYAICALLNHEAGSESDPAYLNEIEKNAKRVVFENGSTLSESLTVSAAPALE